MATTVIDRSSGQMSELRVHCTASLEGGEPPRRVLLAPWGHVESSNGSFVVDDESARLAVAAFEEHATDLPIDYEHQTLGGDYASPDGKAPAAGWIKRVLAEDGVGLLAEIEWTADAKRMLSAKEYRYLSPVAVIRKSDRKLVAIHSAALTNKPAIRGMYPIVNRQETIADSGEDEFAMAPMARLRVELGLAENVEGTEVLLAAGKRIAELEEASKRRRVDERIVEAMRAGKLVEAQRAWAEALVAREEGLFDEWLRTAPAIVRTGRVVGPGAAERRVCGSAASARAEFRASPMLAALTSEEAYVAAAGREAGG